MTTAEILAKLEPTLMQEGVEVEVLREEGQNLHVRAKRVTSGVPVAFLIKAIAGTLRRYHESLREVVLEEYDAGEGIPTPQETSPEFSKVLNHRAPIVPVDTQREWMGLDLRGCDRALAIRALETAHRLWVAQGHDRFLVKGLEEDAPRRAWEKWSHFYRLVRSSYKSPEGDLVVHLGDDDSSGLEGRPTLWMPARVLIPSGSAEV